jgi:hypothetical protein
VRAHASILVLAVLAALAAGCVAPGLVPPPAAPSPTTPAFATTLADVARGTFATASDKRGHGGTLVSVTGVVIDKILSEENDGDWHLYAHDATVARMVVEIVPEDQAAEGKPPTGVPLTLTGTPYCDQAHETESWHGSTCWEIHPVYAWSR